MTVNTRLNGVIRPFELGNAAHLTLAKLDKQTAIEMSDAPYDGEELHQMVTQGYRPLTSVLQRTSGVIGLARETAGH